MAPVAMPPGGPSSAMDTRHWGWMGSGCDRLSSPVRSAWRFPSPGRRVVRRDSQRRMGVKTRLSAWSDSGRHRAPRAQGAVPGTSARGMLISARLPGAAALARGTLVRSSLSLIDATPIASELPRPLQDPDKAWPSRDNGYLPCLCPLCQGGRPAVPHRIRCKARHGLHMTICPTLLRRGMEPVGVPDRNPHATRQAWFRCARE